MKYYVRYLNKDWSDGSETVEADSKQEVRDMFPDKNITSIVKCMEREGRMKKRIRTPEGCEDWDLNQCEVEDDLAREEAYQELMERTKRLY
jgi:hypothetical protein